MEEKRTEKQRMLAGDLYTADCPELAEDNKRISEWMSRYNTALSKTPDERHSMLKEVLGHVGAGVNIRPPFFCDYGYNISIGDGSFINFNCVVLDVVKVMIGNRTKIGSAVQILTADHPRDPKLRAQLLEGAPRHDRIQRMDRERRDHYTRGQRRRRCDHRRWRGCHTRCPRWGDRRRKPCTSKIKAPEP